MVAVVVVVGVDHVEAAGQSFESGFFNAVREAAVAVVAEVVHAALGIEGRDEDVEPPVAVEIVDDASAGQIEDVQAEPGSDVRQPGKLLIGGEHVFGDQPT